MGNAIEKYRSAMDRVQVDAAVLQRTERRIMDALAQDAGQSAADPSISRHSSSRHASTRRSATSRQGLVAHRMFKSARMAMAAVLLAVVLPLGAYAYTMTPVTYLDLDINPSVEIRLSRLGGILDIIGVNQDGMLVLAELNLKGLALPAVIETIVQSAHAKGFLAYDKPGAISLTVADNNDARASKLVALAGDAVRTGLGEEGAGVSFVEASIGLDRVKEARRLEAKDIFISPGKLNLIEKLREVSGEAPFVASDWYGKTVQEIVAATKERKGNPAPEGNSGKSEGAGNAGPSSGSKTTPAALGAGKSSAPGQDKPKENNGNSGKTDGNGSKENNGQSGKPDGNGATTTPGGTSATTEPTDETGNGKPGKETGNGKSDNAPGQVKKSSTGVSSGEDDILPGEVQPDTDGNVTDSSIDANTADPAKEGQAADPSKEDKATGADKEDKTTGTDKTDKTTGPAVDTQQTDSAESASPNNGNSDATTKNVEKDKAAKKDK